MMEQVVRWINDQTELFGRPVPLSTAGMRSALVAETAFRRAAVGAPLLPADDSAERAAAAMISHLPRGQFGDSELTDKEQLESSLIQQNLMRFSQHLDQPKFFFPVPGCGVVNSALADLYSEGHLIEVKTVSRPFRSTDLRQALTYAAMLRASGVSVHTLSLCNPRQAVSFTEKIDDICFSISGITAVELLQDLIETMVGFQVSA